MAENIKITVPGYDKSINIPFEEQYIDLLAQIIKQGAVNLLQIPPAFLSKVFQSTNFKPQCVFDYIPPTSESIEYLLAYSKEIFPSKLLFTHELVRFWYGEDTLSTSDVLKSADLFGDLFVDCELVWYPKEQQIFHIVAKKMVQNWYERTQWKTQLTYSDISFIDTINRAAAYVLDKGQLLSESGKYAEQWLMEYPCFESFVVSIQTKHHKIFQADFEKYVQENFPVTSILRSMVNM